MLLRLFNPAAGRSNSASQGVIQRPKTRLILAKLVAERGQYQRASAKCPIAKSWFGRDARGVQTLMLSSAGICVQVLLAR